MGVWGSICNYWLGLVQVDPIACRKPGAPGSALLVVTTSLADESLCKEPRNLTAPLSPWLDLSVECRVPGALDCAWAQKL